MHSIPLSGTSSPCNLFFLNPGVYYLGQATVGVGTVLIWDFCVAYTRGGYIYNLLAMIRAMIYLSEVGRGMWRVTVLPSVTVAL